MNLSPVQVRMDDVPRVVADALRDTGLAPERLELEITEGMLIEDSAQTLAMLRALKRQGVRMVLDDFGTGYSSLSNLHRCPFDKVKIDRSFIQTLADRDSDGARAIVGAIVVMSHRLGLVVTAEGVETTAQLAMLRVYNCDLVQGFLLARPMRLELVPGYLAAQQTGEPVDQLAVALR